MPIDVGIGVLPTLPLTYADNVVDRSDEAGLDVVMVPDHLMAWFSEAGWNEIGNIASMMRSPHVFMDPFVAIATWAQRTKRIKFATSVTDPIRRSPAQLAFTALTLSHVTEGRFILGIGCGEAENCLPYGSPFNQPVSRLEEALQIIKQLWMEDRVTFEGKFGTLRDAVCALDPYDGTYPQIWIGAHGPRMLELTGLHGDGWLPFLPTTPEEYGARWQVVQRAAERAGRDPSTIVAAFNTPVCMADDHERAHAMIASEAAKQLSLALSDEFFAKLGIKHPLGLPNGLTSYIPEWVSEADLKSALAMIPDPLIAHDLIIHGTPAEVAAQLRDYEEAGMRHFSPLDTSPFTSLPDLPRATERVIELRDIVASGS